MNMLSATSFCFLAIAGNMQVAHSQNYISEQKGNFRLQLNATAGSSTLEAVVNDKRSKSVAYFSGNCNSNAKLMLVIGDPTALQMHFSSGDPKDLNADAILRELGMLIARGCPDIQTLSVFPTHLPSQTAAVRPSRATNWSMDKNATQDRFRPNIALSQLLNTAMTSGGITCNDPADILLDRTQSGSRA